MNKLIVLTLLLITNAFGQTLTSVRPWLGVAIEKGPRGVKVKTAFPDTPAAQAGIQSGDEIVKIEDIKVNLPEELISEVVKKGVGYKVKLEFYRGEKKETREMALAIMPDTLEVAKKKLLNKQAPDFKVKSIRDSKKISSFKKYLGKPVLLEFWATWCPSCVASTPRLLQFAQENKGKIEVISVSNEKLDILKKYLAKVDKLAGKNNNQITFLQSDDPEMNKEYMINSIPYFLLIDKNGQVVDLNLGGGSVLEDLLLKSKNLL